MASSSSSHATASSSLLPVDGACGTNTGPLTDNSSEVLTRKRPSHMMLATLCVRRTKLSGSGALYMSTLRLVFVASRGEDFTGFDMPLATMQSDRQLQQISSTANDATTLSAPGGSCEATLAHRTECVRASWRAGHSHGRPRALDALNSCILR